MILALDFSTVAVGPTIAEIEASFRRQCNQRLHGLRVAYKSIFAETAEIDLEAPVADNLNKLLVDIQSQQLPLLYLIIDEYDNFSNQLITSNKDHLYRELSAEDSFFKTFFKTLKEGRKTGAIANIFITGVLPILIDELASGFNIATFITLRPRFEAMLGFTQAEVDHLLDQVYADYAIDPGTRNEVTDVIRNHYNGYRFVTNEGPALYNSTILMYFLDQFTETKTIPRYLIDANLKTDISWVRRLTASDPVLTEEFVDQLTLYNIIGYDEKFLVEKFNMHQFFEKGFFPISFFYLGMLTRHDAFYLRLPNLSLREIFVEYFNEIHQIDVSTRYTEFMRAFVAQPNLEQLFAGYWREYISQLPEAILARSMKTSTG